jgi:hypothetical protein
VLLISGAQAFRLKWLMNGFLLKCLLLTRKYRICSSTNLSDMCISSFGKTVECRTCSFGRRASWLLTYLGRNINSPDKYSWKENEISTNCQLTPGNVGRSTIDSSE